MRWMRSSKILFQAVVLLLVILINSACSSRDDYSRGYSDGESYGREVGYRFGYESGKKDGYSSGYAQGNTNGFKKGHSEGYTEGYVHGTGFFIKDKSLPTIGLLLLLIASTIGLYYGYKYFRDPVARKTASTIEHIELKRSVDTLKQHLKKQLKNDKEQAQIEARIAMMPIEKLIADFQTQSKVQQKLEQMYMELYFQKLEENFVKNKVLLEDIEHANVSIENKQKMVQHFEKINQDHAKSIQRI